MIITPPNIDDFDGKHNLQVFAGDGLGTDEKSLSNM
jgi:hypothetical protein